MPFWPALIIGVIAFHIARKQRRGPFRPGSDWERRFRSTPRRPSPRTSGAASGQQPAPRRAAGVSGGWDPGGWDARVQSGSPAAGAWGRRLGQRGGGCGGGTAARRQPAARRRPTTRRARSTPPRSGTHRAAGPNAGGPGSGRPERAVRERGGHRVSRRTDRPVPQGRPVGNHGDRSRPADPDIAGPTRPVTGDRGTDRYAGGPVPRRRSHRQRLATPRTTPPAWDPLGAAPFAWDLPDIDLAPAGRPRRWPAARRRLR